MKVLRNLIREVITNNLHLNLIKNVYDSLGVVLDLDIYNYENEQSLVLNSIKVSKEKQRQGLGKEAMGKLIQFADNNNMKVFLTPATDWGSSKSGLVRFYKSFDFVNHTGKNKDWNFKQSMVRFPK